MDNLTGFQAANAIRTRITNSVTPRQLFVTPWEQTDQFLKSSGYKSDSALGPNDLRELARAMRSDEVIVCHVAKTGAGLRVSARLARASSIDQGQPLPVVEVAKPEDAARAIERNYMEARKQLDNVKQCENAIRENNLPKAVAMARAGITRFPNATIARLCLAQAFQNMKQPDSVLKIVDEIKQLDPENSFVHRLAFAAYTEKKDPEKGINALVALWRLEPSNQTLAQQIIQELINLGKPTVALPIVDTMLTRSPGDPTLLRQKWLITLAAAAAITDSGAPRNALLADAIVAGEMMVRNDTAQADSVYFARQMAASAASGNSAKQLEFISLATQKWPRNPDYWYLKAQTERRLGQLPMALQSINRLFGINPQYPNVNVFAAQLYVDMNQLDSAIVIARRAVAAGEDKQVWGRFLMQPTNALLKKATDEKDNAGFRRVLALAQEADRLAPGAISKFFVAFSSYYIANDLLQQVQPILEQAQKTEAARPKAALFARACPLLRDAADMKLNIMTNMPQGGSFNPEVAQQVLGWVNQVSDYLDQATKAACK